MGEDEEEEEEDEESAADEESDAEVVVAVSKKAGPKVVLKAGAHPVGKDGMMSVKASKAAWKKGAAELGKKWKKSELKKQLFAVMPLAERKRRRLEVE